MISFSIVAAQYSVASAHYIFLIHPSVEGHSRCLHFRAIVSRAAMKTAEQVSMEQAVQSVGHMPWSGVVRSQVRVPISENSPHSS